MGKSNLINFKARVYTHDESDIEFRERHNMMDHIVKREKIYALRDKI